MMGKGGEKGLQKAKMSPESASVVCRIETGDSCLLRRSMDVFSQVLKSLAVKPAFTADEVGSVGSQNPTDRRRRQRVRLTHVAGAKNRDGSQNDNTDPGGNQFWSHVEDYFREVTAEDIQLPLPQTRLHLQQDTFDPCFVMPAVHHYHSELCSEGTTENRNTSEIVDRQAGTCVKRNLLAADPASKRMKLLSADCNAAIDSVLSCIEEANALCHVCYSRCSDIKNTMLFCGSCNVLVHERCYGVTVVPEGKWLCSWCLQRSSISKIVSMEDSVNQGAQDLLAESSNQETRFVFPECVLCPMKGGAVKPVLELDPSSRDNERLTKFAHLFCCHWIPETFTDDTKTIKNVEGVREERWQLLCSICRVKFGACIQCSYENCDIAFHPSCAREAKFQMGSSSKEGSHDIELRAFCSTHSACNERTLAGVVVPVFHGRRMTEAKSSVCTIDDVAQGDDAASCPCDIRQHFDGSGSSSMFQRGNDEPAGVPEERVNSKDLVDQSACPSSAAGFSTSSSQFTCFKDDNNRKILKHAINESEKGDGLLHSDIARPPGNDISALQVEDAVHMGKELKNIDRDCLLGASNTPVISNVSIKAHLTDASRPCFENNEFGKMPANCTAEEQHASPANNVCHTMSHGDSDAVHDVCESQSFRSRKFESSHPRVHPCILRQLQEVHESKAGSLIHQQQFSGTGFKPIQELQSLCEHDYCSGSLPENRHKQLDAQWKQLQKARSLGVFNMVAIDELEEELIALQNSLIMIAQANYYSCEQLIMKVITNLPSELRASRAKEEDRLLVNRFLEKAQEAKKQGRKERHRREAQAVLAAATAAVASSPRVGGSWRDAPGPAIVEERLPARGLTTLTSTGRAQNSLVSTSSYESTASPSIISSPYVGKPSISKPVKVNLAAHPSSSRSGLHVEGMGPNAIACESPVMKSFADDFLDSKEQPNCCDICGSQDDCTTNRIVYCQNCRVAVHQDCYGISNFPIGAWYCQPCSDFVTESLVSADGRELGPCVQCVLCGHHSGAFKRSSDRQWVHVFCAQWMPELKIGKDQSDFVEGLETILPDRLSASCGVCHLRKGACLRCNFGHCHGAFHPLCARKAGFYMNVKHNGAGRAQYRAYCEKHSPQQRMKAETRKCKPDELIVLRRIRVELERVRLICERISRRERLKRDLLNCKRDILTCQLATLPTLLHAPDTQSATATHSDTSSQIYTGHDTRFEETPQVEKLSKNSLASTTQRVDGKVSHNQDEAVEVSECEQSMIHGAVGSRSLQHSDLSKQVPAKLQGGPSLASAYGLPHIKPPSQPILPINEGGDRCLKTGGQKRLRIRKAEPLHSEVVMTPSEASVQNQRLPKGYAYVPVVLLSKEKAAPPGSGEDT